MFTQWQIDYQVSIIRKGWDGSPIDACALILATAYLQAWIDHLTAFATLAPDSPPAAWCKAEIWQLTRVLATLDTRPLIEKLDSRYKEIIK